MGEGVEKWIEGSEERMRGCRGKIERVQKNERISKILLEGVGKGKRV